MSVSSDSFASLASSGISNAALVARFRDSDPNAFDEFFSRHRKLVFGVCFRFLAHHHDAEDATQETFRRAASAIDRWDPQRPIEPWLVTIAGNWCRTLLRRRGRETLIESIDDLPADRCAAKLTGQTLPEASLVFDEWIGQGLRQLPQNQRRAFELIHQQDLSYPQVARRMGHPTGTIKAWVHRARHSLRQWIQRENPHAERSTEAGQAETENQSARTESAMRAITASVAMVAIGIAALTIRGTIPQGTDIQSTALLSTALQSEISPAITKQPSGAAAEFSVSIRAEQLALTESTEATVSSWQLASIQAFTDPRLNFQAIETMPEGTVPIESWIEQSSPVLTELQQGIAPVSRTLRNVMMLFSVDVKTKATFSTTTANNNYS